MFNRMVKAWVFFSSISILLAILGGVVQLFLLLLKKATFMEVSEYWGALILAALLNYTIIATLNYIVRGKVTIWYRDL